MNWRKLDGARIADIVTEVENAIIKEVMLGNKLRICIGTDSQIKGLSVEYATAIVFIREKRGGFMFVNKQTQTEAKKIKHRMLDEVSMSIAIAYKLCDLLERYDIPMEVHADINTDPQFQSNVALKEAMGYIMGMGYEFKAKPHAFASSNCANKIVQ